MDNKRRNSFIGVLLNSFKAMLLGDKYLIRNEELYSPATTSLKRFLKNKQALYCVCILFVLIILDLVLSFIYKVDKNYFDYTQTNISPCVSFMDVSKELNGNLKSLGIGSTFGVGIDNEGKLYTWGMLDSVVTKKLRESLNTEIRYRSVSAGLDHILAITEDGKVKTWAPDRFDLNDIPEELKKRTDVKQVVAGHQFSVAVTYDGYMYIWGNTTYLGILNQDTIPDTVQGRIREVDVSVDNIIIITTSGSVAVIGQQNALVTNIFPVTNIVDVAATDYSVAVLTDNGRVVIWGIDIYGLLTKPKDLTTNIVEISAGRKHFNALDANGNIYSWGDNKFGQLNTPRDIKIGKVKINKLYSNYFQNYAIDDNNNIMTWGLNGYLMGTDDYGRDIFSRFLTGGKITLLIGLAAVIIQLFFGLLIGSIAGFYGRRIDKIFMSITELIGSIPFLPISITFIALIDSNITDLMRIFILILILGILGINSVARLVRGLVIKERQKEYVLAAKATGLKTGSILIKQIIPNIISSIIANSTLAYANCLLMESTLSYLGFGAIKTYPTWGNMLSDLTSTGILRDYWWRWIFPALGLSIFIILVNYIGYAISLSIDPKENSDRRRV